jgi:hypothetical protein
MKKILLMIVVLASLICFVEANAGIVYLGTNNVPTEFMRASGEGTGSKSLGTGQCVFKGVWVATDGTNDVTVNVYDGSTAAGKKLIPSIVIPGESRYGGAMFDPGVLINTDIYVSVDTSGTVSWQVYFDNGR